MKTIIFDLNSLTLSKQQIDSEMSSLLSKVMEEYTVGIISSYNWKQLQAQLINSLSNASNLDKLFIIGSSGAEMYQTWGKYGWIPTFQEKLSDSDLDKIKRVLDDVVRNFKYSEKIWGKQIELQDCQVLFSPLGQNVPHNQSVTFDPSYKIRNIIVENISNKLPDYEVNVADYSSVSITKRGINRKSGLDEFMKRTHLSKDDVLYIGTDIETDKIGEPAIEVGFEYYQVTDFEATKQWIRDLLTEPSKAVANA